MRLSRVVACSLSVACLRRRRRARHPWAPAPGLAGPRRRTTARRRMAVRAHAVLGATVVVVQPRSGPSAGPAAPAASHHRNHLERRAPTRRRRDHRDAMDDWDADGRWTRCGHHGTAASPGGEASGSRAGPMPRNLVASSRGSGDRAQDGFRTSRLPCGQEWVVRPDGARRRAGRAAWSTRRRGTRATWRSPVGSPLGGQHLHGGADGPGQGRCFMGVERTGRPGRSSRERQRISSTSGFPRPARRCWSSRTAFSGADRPRAERSSSTVTVDASGPSVETSGRLPPAGTSWVDDRQGSALDELSAKRTHAGSTRRLENSGVRRHPPASTAEPAGHPESPNRDGPAAHRHHQQLPAAVRPGPRLPAPRRRSTSADRPCLRNQLSRGVDPLTVPPHDRFDRRWNISTSSAPARWFPVVCRQPERPHGRSVDIDGVEGRRARQPGRRQGPSSPTDITDRPRPDPRGGKLVGQQSDVGARRGASPGSQGRRATGPDGRSGRLGRSAPRLGATDQVEGELAAARPHLAAGEVVLGV